MIKINISADTAALTRMFSSLSRSEVARATSDAINRSLHRGRTEGRKAVKSAYNKPSRYLNYVDFSRSRVNTLSGYIYGRTSHLPMDVFNPKFQAVSMGVVRGTTTITRRGAAKTSISRNKKRSPGVSIEVVKGRRSLVPYAFMLPSSKPRVFARGDYRSGGSYAFIQRHKREENDKGNDRVTNLLSVTVYGALINKKVLPVIEEKVKTAYPESLHNALLRRIKR